MERSATADRSADRWEAHLLVVDRGSLLAHTLLGRLGVLRFAGQAEIAAHGSETQQRQGDWSSGSSCAAIAAACISAVLPVARSSGSCDDAILLARCRRTGNSGKYRAQRHHEIR